MKITCPHCNKEIVGELVSNVGEENRFTMVITLEEGRMLNAKTLAGSIENMGKLMEASAKSFGRKVNTLVETISVKENEITVGFLITAAKQRTKG